MKSFLQYLQENSNLYIQSIDDVEDNALKRLFNTTSEKLKNQTVPSELQQALERYVGGGSTDINTKLRAGEIDPLAKQMDELIHKFGIKRDTPTTVWRVMPSKYIKSGIEPGFLSTTVDRKIAFSRAARIPESSVLRIDIPAGVPHVSNTTGNWTGENELLFGRNQNLKIDVNPKTIKVVKDIPAFSGNPDADFPTEARPREQRVTEIPVHRATIVTDTPNPTQTPKPVTPTPKPKTPKTLTTPTLPEVPKLPEVPVTPKSSGWKLPTVGELGSRLRSKLIRSLPTMGQVADVLDMGSPEALAAGFAIGMAQANWDAIKTTPAWAAEKMGQKVETPDAASIGQLEDGEEERKNTPSRYRK
jgi:hypothetical protein